MLKLRRSCKDRISLIVFFTIYLFLLVAPFTKVMLMDKTSLEKISALIFPRFFLRSLLIYGIFLIFYIGMSIWVFIDLVVLSYLLVFANIIFNIYMVSVYKWDISKIAGPTVLLLWFSFYFFFYRKTLLVVFKTFRCSAAVIKYYIHWIMFVSMLGATLFMPNYIMIFVIAADVQQNLINITFLIILNIYNIWYLITLKSFIDCYISALIYYRIYGIKNAGKEACKTAVMSIGTCVNAGLFELIFNLLSFLIKYQTRKSEWFTSKLIAAFSRWLLNGLVDVVLIFVDIYHKFVMGFTSLHNTNYRDGIKLTYKNISSFKDYPVVNFLTFKLVLTGMEFIGLIIMALVIIYDLFYNGIIQSISKKINEGAGDVEFIVLKTLQIIAAPLSGFAITRFIYRGILSGSIAVLLLYCIDKETLNLQFPDFIMEKEI